MQCCFATAGCTGSERIISRRYTLALQYQVSHIYNDSTQGLQGRSVMLHGHNAMQTSPDSPHILKIHRFPTCSSHIFGLHMSSPSSPPWEYLKISKVLRWFRSAVMMLSAWASHCDVARIAKVERRKDG